MEKKKWSKPVIEVVPLEFDKNMSSVCFSTSSTTQNTPHNAPCQIPGVSKCWTGGQ